MSIQMRCVQYLHVQNWSEWRAQSFVNLVELYILPNSCRIAYVRKVSTAAVSPCLVLHSSFIMLCHLMMLSSHLSAVPAKLEKSLTFTETCGSPGCWKPSVNQAREEDRLAVQTAYSRILVSAYCLEVEGSGPFCSVSQVLTSSHYSSRFWLWPWLWLGFGLALASPLPRSIVRPFVLSDIQRNTWNNNWLTPNAELSLIFLNWGLL